MRRFRIGEVCDALGVKPHVLRYWEQQIGILSPAKNRAGRREYSFSDLQTLFRVKFLIEQRRYTLEGAAQKILEEAGGRHADLKATIQELRRTLVGQLAAVRRLGAAMDRIDPPPHAGEGFPSIERAWHRWSPAQRERVRKALLRWEHAAELRSFLAERAANEGRKGSEERPASEERNTSDGQPEAPLRCTVVGAGESTQSLLERGEIRKLSRFFVTPGITVVTIVPDPGTTSGADIPRILRRLARVAATLRCLAYATGSQPVWRVAAPLEYVSAVRSALLEQGWFGLRAELVSVDGMPGVPSGAERNQPQLTPELDLLTYRSAELSLLWASFWERERSAAVLVCRLSSSVPDSDWDLLDLVAAHLGRGADVTARVTTRDARPGQQGERSRFAPTGDFVLRPAALGEIRSRLHPRSVPATNSVLIPGAHSDDTEDVENRLFYLRVEDLLRAAAKPLVVAAGGDAGVVGG